MHRPRRATPGSALASPRLDCLTTSSLGSSSLRNDASEDDGLTAHDRTFDASILIRASCATTILPQRRKQPTAASMPAPPASRTSVMRPRPPKPRTPRCVTISYFPRPTQKRTRRLAAHTRTHAARDVSVAARKPVAALQLLARRRNLRARRRRHVSQEKSTVTPKPGSHPAPRRRRRRSFARRAATVHGFKLQGHSVA